MMRSGGIAAIGHEGFEIIPIPIDLARLRDSQAVESDVTLTEKRIEEINSYGCEVCRVHVLPYLLHLGYRFRYLGRPKYNYRRVSEISNRSDPLGQRVCRPLDRLENRENVEVAANGHGFRRHGWTVMYFRRYSFMLFCLVYLFFACFGCGTSSTISTVSTQLAD